ncbi:MAG TPA: permease prefix domain 1-containing protein [Actinocrinis sp.]|uniref:permease prefix domain 1-containing protein n=1 Tax=Actinocrinis sp. TaxID=1920516 RepID=UPI002DDDB285|nr:permease prefix domain 1-containing protein [Actinocrinis sp.]HEV3170792.1 permease prefix domain 1-containing protein [Actinocrinis sp.]
MTKPAEALPPAVEDYLAEVTARLPGSARVHADIVAELRAGLLDATDSHQCAGLSPAEAAQAAVLEFGDPGEIADGFKGEIAASHARRVAFALLLTGPLVGSLWIVSAATSHLAIRLAALWQWSATTAGIGVGIHLVAVAAMVTAWAALLGIAVTGRLTRWLPAKPSRAPIAAAVAGYGAVGADALGLVLLAAELTLAPGRLSPLPVAAAAVASLVRLLLASRAAHRCLALRASLA